LAGFSPLRLREEQNRGGPGWGKPGGQGAEPPGGGLWGVSPTKSKGGRVAHISNLPTSGAQSASEPLAHGGGQKGWRGRSPLPGVLGDVPPKTSKKGRVANSYHPTTSGTQNAGKPLAHGGGQNGGPGGRSPHGGGRGGCPPTKSKGGRVAHISNLPTSGAQSASEPLAHGGGQKGWRGQPPPRGFWGMCPQKLQRRGE
jgi:hypothetical protein